MQRLSGRERLSIHAVSELIEPKSKDTNFIEHELNKLAKALHIPVGLIRGDDVVIDLLGVSEGVGDELFEFEVRLHKVAPQIAEQRLTVGQLVRLLVSASHEAAISSNNSPGSGKAI